MGIINKLIKTTMRTAIKSIALIGVTNALKIHQEESND